MFCPTQLPLRCGNNFHGIKFQWEKKSWDIISSMRAWDEKCEIFSPNEIWYICYTMYGATKFHKIKGHQPDTATVGGAPSVSILFSQNTPLADISLV